MRLNHQVRNYWEQEPCGTGREIVGEVPERTRAWFETIEQTRYDREPMIHSVAQFTRYHGKRVLEVGVGAGTDHLQWARAGAECHGVDLTDAAIEVTRQRLAMYGFRSNLQRTDAEVLPFDDGYFDVVYSWGVIHHSEHPELILNEIHRVLKPSGRFLGMMYGRYSPLVLRAWVQNALLKGRPWRTFSDVVWNHVESVGTKAYTRRELAGFFARFRDVQLEPVVTPYDKRRFPDLIAGVLPDRFGWFITIRAAK